MAGRRGRGREKDTHLASIGKIAQLLLLVLLNATLLFLRTFLKVVLERISLYDVLHIMQLVSWARL